MGNCGCENGVSLGLEPEELIKEVLDTYTLNNLTQGDISRILFNRIKGGNESLIRINLEISEKNYALIASDLLNKDDFNKKDPSKKSQDNHPEIFAKFIKGLYPLLNINNSRNSVIFKLIMFPFTLEKEPEQKNEKKEEYEKKIKEIRENNAKYLLHLFKYANFNNEQIDKDNNSIKYISLCNAFTIYLSMILVGFTKILYSCIDNKEENEQFKIEMESHLKRFFNKDYIINFYKKISASLYCDFEEQNEITLEQYLIQEDQFVDFCNNNLYLFHYFELRKKFIDYVKTEEEVNNKGVIGFFTGK